MSKSSKNYYLEPVKIIRDLVHGYINLTAFDLEIIDTLEFQRLKDIRQLTCQNVYPSAFHTRFEHSLGVMELTRQAAKNLNRNGSIVKKGGTGKEFIDENLCFNVSLAALLHDVGHCPFSHMGESEFEEEEVKKRLLSAVKSKIDSPDLIQYLDACIRDKKKIGAVHEQLSCIVILEKYVTILDKAVVKPSNNKCGISVDYELIVRCILGIEYNVSSQILLEENGIKNALVRLINSSVFDMDKLDYVMRDSLLTGIGTPIIDTGRLFRNMYFNSEYNIVFTSKAVPALQNLIDARDGLYMYVYNHHAVIFSDFMNTYISRRLAHNAQVYSDLKENKNEKVKITDLGLIEKSYLFSIDAILEERRSDSDWNSLLTTIDTNFTENEEEIKSKIRKIGEMKELTPEQEAKVNRLANKIVVAYKLIRNYKKREFLKPWWKTVFEFTNFMERNFPDDSIRTQLSQLICYGNKQIEAAEFRSQIVKHVSYITKP